MLSQNQRDVEYITITSDNYQEKIKLFKEQLKKQDDSTKTDNNETSDKPLNNEISKLLYDEAKKIEEEVIAGSNLKEISEKYGLSYKSISKINETSQRDLPKFHQFLKNALAAGENYPSEAFKIDENNDSLGYYILNIPKMHKSSYKPLNEETEKEIIQFIQEEKKEQIAKKQAVKLYNLVISKKKSVNDIIKENPNMSLQETRFTRTSSDINVNLLTNIFEIKNKNAYTNLFSSLNDRYNFQFAIVKEIQLPKYDKSSEKVKIVKTQLTNYLTNTVNQEFLNYLYSKYEVKIFSKKLEEL